MKYFFVIIPNLGGIRFVGVALMCLVCLTAVGLGIWVRLKGETRIVHEMQPNFLIVICLGVFIMVSFEQSLFCVTLFLICINVLLHVR